MRVENISGKIDQDLVVIARKEPGDPDIVFVAGVIAGKKNVIAHVWFEVDKRQQEPHLRDGQNKEKEGLFAEKPVFSHAISIYDNRRERNLSLRALKFAGRGAVPRGEVFV